MILGSHRQPVSYDVRVSLVLLINAIERRGRHCGIACSSNIPPQRFFLSFHSACGCIVKADVVTGRVVVIVQGSISYPVVGRVG